MELLPCPFCGSNELTEDHYDVISCDKCHAYAHKEFWNKREYMFGELKVIDEKKYSPWTSVKDRLPEKPGYYLCAYFNSANYGASPYSHEVFCFTAKEFWINKNLMCADDKDGWATVTHWMPLPSLPENK